MKKNGEQKSGETIQISGSDFPPFSKLYYNSNKAKLYEVKEKGGKLLPEIWLVSSDFCSKFKII